MCLIDNLIAWIYLPILNFISIFFTDFFYINTTGVQKYIQTVLYCLHSETVGVFLSSILCRNKISTSCSTYYSALVTVLFGKCFFSSVVKKTKTDKILRALHPLAVYDNNIIYNTVYRKSITKGVYFVFRILLVYTIYDVWPFSRETSVPRSIY